MFFSAKRPVVLCVSLSYAYVQDESGLSVPSMAYWIADCIKLRYAEIPGNIAEIGYTAETERVLVVGRHISFVLFHIIPFGFFKVNSSALRKTQKSHVFLTHISGHSTARSLQPQRNAPCCILLLFDQHDFQSRETIPVMLSTVNLY